MPKMNVIKSIYVDAAPEKIYPIINDLSNWEQWSPWVIAEPNAQLNVAADGKYHEWDGEIIGAGNLKIKEEVENQSVTMALNFLKPWKSKAITRFALKKKAKGTEVVWTMDSSLPFFLFWMKKQMEIFVGMDYERGLTMLKDLVETGSSNSSLNFKGIKTFNATKYVGLKSQCSSSNLGQSMEKDFTLELVDLKTGYERTTRDILVVSGYLNQHHLTVLVNHWPSRRGGKIRSAPQRFKAAQLHRKITDLIARKHPKGKIISMGDYNDDPKDKSLQWIMEKKGEKILHNPMLAMAKKGVGSLAYNDRWHLFDQMLFSLNWYNDPSLLLLKTAVYSPPKLRTLRGRYQGYPFRTVIRGNTLEGYSDHFPVYTILGEKKD